MGTVIYILLANYTLTLLALGLMAAGISLWGRPRPLTASAVVEDVFAYFLLCSVGVSFFYSFVVHVFFGEMTDRFIGWEPSPFQAELGWHAWDTRRSAFSRTGETSACVPPR